MAHSDGEQGLHVSRAEIERMTSAAAVIRDCSRELAARDASLLSEVTAGTAAISEWRHYPEGEAYDPNSHSQYFFHAHGAKGRPAAEQAISTPFCVPRECRSVSRRCSFPSLRSPMFRPCRRKRRR